MVISIPFALCIDDSSVVQLSELKMQELLMNAVFWNFHESLYTAVARGDRSLPHCEWRSENGKFEITCMNGIIKGFRCHQSMQHMNIRFLPQTLSFIDIDGARQEYEMPVRWLPRDLEKFTFQFNQLHGSLDLTCLPANIQVFNVHYNNFTGEICLTQLPSKLTRLILSSNSFVQKVVPYSLPSSVEIIDLRFGNSIKALVPLSKEQSVRRNDIIFVDPKQTKLY